jgi:hypothetical protein
LALSFFRFVEPTEGRILVDGVDISKIGLTDLRSRLTIIPRMLVLFFFKCFRAHLIVFLEDPTILSGSLRSSLDVFEEYQDTEIVSYMPRSLMVAYDDDAYCLYISMKHFVVSISSHPKTPPPKHLTWSTPMFSGTWTHLFQKEVITFPQG